MLFYFHNKKSVFKVQFSHLYTSYRCMASKEKIELLFKTNYARMHRLAALILHDQEAAHDVVHDVFATVLNKHSDETVDTPYLMTSVRNQCVDILRKLDVREKFRNLYLNETELITSDRFPDEEMVQIVEQNLSTLPSQTAKAFSMRFIEGLPTIEIAEKMKISDRMVYKHLNNAINLLRIKLKNYE